jgi:hypothetical protein
LVENSEGWDSALGGLNLSEQGLFRWVVLLLLDANYFPHLRGSSIATASDWLENNPGFLEIMEEN